MKLYADDGTRLAPPPRRVAILGMGPTLHDFTLLRLRQPQPGGVVDEIWGLNNVAAVHKCDVCFCMDDLVEMLERPFMGNKEKGLPPAVFWDKSNPDLTAWARETDVPIMTSRSYRPRYPTTVEFPLEAVVKSVFEGRIGFHFANSTTYAIAYAWYLGVQEIHMYGTDFAYPGDDPYERRRYLEAARANVEALLLAGYMLGKFTFHLSANTSLFDTMQGRKFYGYADGRSALVPQMIVSRSIEDDRPALPASTATPDGAAAGVPAVVAIQPASPAAAIAGQTAAGDTGSGSGSTGAGDGDQGSGQAAAAAFDPAERAAAE